MRENCTYSLSGGRWPARKRATSDPTPSAGQLLCLDRGLRPSSETDGPAVGDPLDRVAERFRRPVESAARKPLPTLPDRLLLDVLLVGMGHGQCIRQGRLSAPAHAVAGAA